MKAIFVVALLAIAMFWPLLWRRKTPQRIGIESVKSLMLMGLMKKLLKL